MKSYFIIFLCSVGQIGAMENAITKKLCDRLQEIRIDFGNEIKEVYKKPEKQTVLELKEEDGIVYNGFKKFLGNIYSYKSEKLIGGLLNTPPYVCMVNANKYVVRTFSGSSEIQHDKMIMHYLAASKGIAPKTHYYYHDDVFSFLIMDFVATPTLSVEQANRSEVLDLIAQKVRSVAQFDISIETANKENLFDEIIRHYNSVKSKKLSELDSIVEEIKIKAEILYQKIEDEKRPLVINHNDFHLRNIFFTNNDIKVIDWDTIGANYEFFDLVGYSLFSCLEQEEDRYLLARYLQYMPAISDIQYFKKIKLMGRICLVLSCFEFIEYVPKSLLEDTIKDFQHYATAFAQDASSDSSEFLYAFGMSQLRDFREEYKRFENNITVY